MSALDPEVALALKYQADHAWETRRGWSVIRSGEKAFCMHGCNQFVNPPTAVFVLVYGGYRKDFACRKHAERAGVPAVVIAEVGA